MKNKDKEVTSWKKFKKTNTTPKQNSANWRKREKLCLTPLVSVYIAFVTQRQCRHNRCGQKTPAKDNTQTVCHPRR